MKFSLCSSEGRIPCSGDTSLIGTFQRECPEKRRFSGPLHLSGIEQSKSDRTLEAANRKGEVSDQVVMKLDT